METFFIKYGHKWAYYLDVYHSLVEIGVENSFLSPKNLSETKFANWVMEVYSRFMDIYKPLTIMLETKEMCRSGVSADKKAAKADAIIGKEI